MIRPTMAFAWLLAGIVLSVCAVPLSAQTTQSVEAPTSGGAGIYRANRWGVVNTVVENPADQHVQRLLVINFSGLPAFTTGYDLWLPAQSRRRVQLPVYLGDIPAQTTTVSPQMLLLDTSGPTERQMNSRLSSQGILPVTSEQSVTAILIDQQQPSTDAVNELLAASRSSMGWAKSVATLTPEQLPMQVAGWDAIDALVIASDQLRLNPGQIQAIRQWVIDGGKLWVMLDRCNPALLTAILRDDWTSHIVDQTRLTRFTMVDTTGRQQPRQLDIPINFARVFAGPDMRVMHTIDGWPASMQKSIGRGRLLVTTLAAEGWYEGKINHQGVILFEASQALEMLAGDFHQPREKSMLSQRVMHDYVKERIGYEIVSRRIVVSVLGVYVLTIFAVGMLLWNRQRLEYIAPLAMVIALITASLLLAMGMTKRQRLPLTIANVQFIQMVPSQIVANVHGEIGVYSPDEIPGAFSTTGGGVLWSRDSPRMRSARMVWTDHDHWRWRNMTLPAGAVELMTFRQQIPMAQRVRGYATFDARGVMAIINPGPLKGLTDPMIAAPNGHMIVAAETRGQTTLYRAGRDITLTMSQLVLGDAQQRHREIYRKLFQDHRPGGDEISLLLWADSIETGIDLPGKAYRRGEAIVQVPLTLVAPSDFPQQFTSAREWRINIPSVFIPFEVVRYDDMVSSVFDSRTRQWLTTTRPSTVAMKFQVPKAVLPVRLDSGLLTLDIHAPKRKIELFRIIGDHQRPLHTRGGPSGLYEIHLTDDDLTIDDSASLLLLLRVHDDGQGGDTPWHVRSVQLELSGAHHLGTGARKPAMVEPIDAEIAPPPQE